MKDGVRSGRVFDPYAARDLGDSYPAALRTMEWAVDLHDNLLSGTTRRRVNGVGGALVLVLLATGAVIWWQGRTGWRRVLVVTRASPRPLVWQLHSALGFWSLALLFVWAHSHWAGRHGRRPLINVYLPCLLHTCFRRRPILIQRAGRFGPIPMFLRKRPCTDSVQNPSAETRPNVIHAPASRRRRPLMRVATKSRSRRPARRQPPPECVFGQRKRLSAQILNGGAHGRRDRRCDRSLDLEAEADSAYKRPYVSRRARRGGLAVGRLSGGRIGRGRYQGRAGPVPGRSGFGIFPFELEMPARAGGA